MDAMRENLNLFLKTIAKLKAGQDVLLITDNYSRPKSIGQMVMELAISFGANPIWVVMEPRTHVGHEPPKIIADAIDNSDNVFVVENNASGQLAHLIQAETGENMEGRILKYDGRPFMSSDIIQVVKRKVC